MKRTLYYLLVLPLVLVFAACSGDQPEDIASDDPPEGITVGAIAPDFTLPEVTGGEVSLSDYSGENVLLFFHMAVG